MTSQHNSTIVALTSLSPAEPAVARQQNAVSSWRQCGLRVISFNHPSELGTLASRYDVEFVPVEQTTAHLFGRHFVPINAMLKWAGAYGGPVLIVNSDIELRLEPWQLQRVRFAANGGLCYFIRHNHDGAIERAEEEPFGIDAFLFSGDDARLFPESFLSMGQPYWDYWMLQVFASSGRPLTRIDFPAAYHHEHPRQWSWDAWHACALEFGRVTGELAAHERALDACFAMESRVRAHVDRVRTRLAREPLSIREWVERTFAHPEPRTFLELGAHRGTDTAWLSQIPGVTIHAFEPDPRNEQPPRPNVTLHRAAIAAADGHADFRLSEVGWGQVWTHSSSLKPPKNHLLRYPVTFGATIRVETVSLDSFAQRAGLSRVDFIWADIQGAEADMIRGGRGMLRRTRYLFTEYSDDELYEGQPTLDDILAMLPDFRVVEVWPFDVLLENRALAETARAIEGAA
jgi:FkbM family methyltransferase